MGSLGSFHLTFVGKICVSLFPFISDATIQLNIDSVNRKELKC